MQTQYMDQGPEEFVEQEIHLRDYLRIVSKRRYVVLTMLAIVFLATAVLTFTSTPIYTAASDVLIEHNYGSKGLDSRYYGYDPDFLDTQAQIIESSSVALKVVDNLKLATRYRQYFFPDEKDISLLDSWRHKIASFFHPIGAFIGNITGGDHQKDGDTPSPLVAPKTDAEVIAGIIQDGLNVTPVKNTKIVSISYSCEDPAMAKLVADAVVKAYMDEMLEIKLSSSNYSVKWMTDKAREEQEKLAHSEKALQRFQRDNDLVTVEDKLTVLPQKLSEFGSQISKAEADKKELQDLIDQIKAAGNDIDKLEQIPTLATNEVLKSIRERIYKATQTIEDLSQKYGPKHPKMINAKEELRNLHAEKRHEIDRILSSITNSYKLAASKEKSLEELLAQTKARMLDLNEKFMQYQIMKREVDNNRAMLETLQTTIKKESVTEQSQSVNIWVTKKAELPISPSEAEENSEPPAGAHPGALWRARSGVFHRIS